MKFALTVLFFIITKTIYAQNVNAFLGHWSSVNHEKGRDLSFSNAIRTRKGNLSDFYANPFDSDCANKQVKDTTKDDNWNSCWKGVSDIDTLILNKKDSFFMVPIASTIFKSIKPSINKYNKSNKNIQLTRTFIRCTYRNGTSASFKNNFKEGFDTYIRYTFVGALEIIDYYLLKVQFYETMNYLLVDKENGYEIPLLSEPHFSDNNEYFACNLCTYLGDSGGFQIFKVKKNGKVKEIESVIKNNGWLPSLIKWSGNNELLFEKDMNCNEKRYSKLTLK